MTNKALLNKISNGNSSLKDIFLGLGKYLEKEQKDLIFNRKSRQEENEYFKFMKFLFSSPDKSAG